MQTKRPIMRLGWLCGALIVALRVAAAGAERATGMPVTVVEAVAWDRVDVPLGSAGWPGWKIDSGRYRTDSTSRVREVEPTLRRLPFNEREALDALRPLTVWRDFSGGYARADVEAPAVAWPSGSPAADWWSRPYLVPARLLAATPWMTGEAAARTEPEAIETALPGGDRAPEDLIARLRVVFESEGVPSRWVWIAEAESLLDPEACSTRGAVGLFQLMPETARRFGLAVHPVDDRCVPEKNARAAARYLKTLHRQFGCWSLALAAYNAGEGRVRRVLKQHGARSFADIVRYLPRETRSYVPRVLALVEAREEQRPAGVGGADAASL